MTPFIRKIVHHWSAIPGKADDGRQLGVPLPEIPAVHGDPRYSVEITPGPYDCHRTSSIDVELDATCEVCMRSPLRVIAFTNMGCEGDGEKRVCGSCLATLANLITADKDLESMPTEHYETTRVRTKSPWGDGWVENYSGQTTRIPDPGNS